MLWIPMGQLVMFAHWQKCSADSNYNEAWNFEQTSDQSNQMQWCFAWSNPHKQLLENKKVKYPRNFNISDLKGNLQMLFKIKGYYV